MKNDIPPRFASSLEHAETTEKKWGKRLFDICFSGCVLLFGAPVYLLLMGLIKLTDPGPAFYKGARMGQGGKIIYCWKFRTMCVDAEKKLQAILESDPEMLQEWKMYHKLKNDPRLTKMGNFLRKSSLDELPQFWNVLKGDLSVVGPRPIEIKKLEQAASEIREKYKEKTEKILSAKPGITCIWQTQGRNLLTLEQRAILEEKYIDTQSFFLDLKIILKTICILLFPKGAY